MITYRRNLSLSLVSCYRSSDVNKQKNSGVKNIIAVEETQKGGCIIPVN